MRVNDRRPVLSGDSDTLHAVWNIAMKILMLTRMLQKLSNS